VWTVAGAVIWSFLGFSVAEVDCVVHAQARPSTREKELPCDAAARPSVFDELIGIQGTEGLL
jgi:hypothetical protein